MNRVKQTAIRTKNYVRTHKSTLVVGVVAISAIALQQRNNREFYKFLEEKGIDPVEFYCPEAYEESQS